MKTHSFKFILLGLLVALLSLYAVFASSAESPALIHSPVNSDEALKKEALAILQAKCNICHKKQNPFMLFNEKNMTRRANRIYQKVFIERSMPKGDEVQLSREEYLTLKKWIKSQSL